MSICYYPELCKGQCNTCRLYEEGRLLPVHPLPALLGPCEIDAGMVYVHHCDPDHRIAPVVTWYNESWGLPMPSDHGVADYGRD